MQRKVLFIYRDGVLTKGPPADSLDQLEFLPGLIRNLYFIRNNLDFEWVMMTSRQGLGTHVHTQEKMDHVQAKMLDILAGEGITFDNIFCDNNWVNFYINGNYDLANSYIIGHRKTDRHLAEKLDCKFIQLSTPEYTPNAVENTAKDNYLYHSWEQIKELLYAGERQSTIQRTTKETDILVRVNIDGSGRCDISTGIGFFDHLLEQIGKHGGLDMTIKVKGDLHVDEHHTIEDTAIALGEALYQALGNKRGIERYGFCLPMDDCLCSVALDFGGRSWIDCDVEFKKEKIGDLPTEMIFHFLKSFSDAAKMNLHIKVEGENEHHKAESIFKALARSIKAAVKRDVYKYDLPTTKGII